MGIQTFTAQVIEKKQLTEDVILLAFNAPDDFTFQAGQFITITIKVQDEKRLKSYSILSPPSQDRVELCIKLVPGGFASGVFEKTIVGDEFEIKGPFGHFVFDETSLNEEAWFLGAGTGVAPLYSMIAEYVPKLPDKKFVLLFGVRTQENLFLHEKFLALQKKYPNFSYRPVLSKEVWGGLRGHVQDNLPENLQNKTFYICGLKELVLETKELLANRGVDPKDIKSERYN